MNLFIVAALAAGALLSSFVFFIGNGGDEYLVIALSFLIVLPAALAAGHRDVKDVFSPLKIYTYILIISSPLFSVYVFFFAIDWKYGYALFWQEFIDLIPGIFLIAFATFTMIAGYYAAGTSYFKLGNRTARANFSKKKLIILTIITLCISIFAGYMFSLDVNYAASLEENVLARKSVHESTVGISVRGSALTHWRFLGISLPHGMIIVYLTLVWVGKVRASKYDYVLMGLLFISASFIPFIASSRTPILEILVVMVMVRHYLVKKIALSRVLVIGFIIMIVIGSLGELRRNPDQLALSSFATSFESVVASQYFVDLGKTSIIVNRVPDQVDYLYGSSLMSVFLAVIPRQIWPDKPVVRIGYYVGQNIIQLDNQTGIPPGFIAEIYLNFGYWGIFPVFIVLGLVLAKLYNTVRREQNYVTTLLYVLSVVTISLSLLSTDLTYAILQAVFYFIPIAIFTLMAKSSKIS